MSAWGIGSFENDEALDYVGEVVADGPVALWEALEVAMDEEDYLELPEGARAVAAAEIVAAHRTRDWSRLRLKHDASLFIVSPEDHAALAAQVIEVSDDLRDLALSALERVTAAASELREVREADDDFGAWLAEVEEVRRRLRG